MTEYLKHPKKLFIGNKDGSKNYILTRYSKIFYILVAEDKNQVVVSFSRQDSSPAMVTEKDMDAIKELFFVNPENIETQKMVSGVHLIQNKVA